MRAMVVGLLLLCPTAIHAQCATWQVNNVQTYMAPRLDPIGATVGTSPTLFATNVPLAQTIVVPFTYTFTGAEPAGTYFGYAEIVPAGGPPFQPLSANVTAFQFSP